MTQDDPIHAALRARRPGVTALAHGGGDPLDLAAARLPDVPIAEARAAAMTVDGLIDPPFADPHAHPDHAALRLAVAATMADLTPARGATRRWADLADGLRADAECRPRVWAALSEDAVALAASLGLEGRGARLVDAVAHAVLVQLPPAVIAAAQAGVVAAARQARLADARTWLRLLPAASRAPLDHAIDLVEARALPMAADDGTSPVVERVVVGTACDGEVCLAVSPEGLMVEWEGDGPPPDTLHIASRTAEQLPASASPARRAWRLDGSAHAGSLVLALGEASVPLDLSVRPR